MSGRERSVTNLTIEGYSLVNGPIPVEESQGAFRRRPNAARALLDDADTFGLPKRFDQGSLPEHDRLDPRSHDEGPRDVLVHRRVKGVSVATFVDLEELRA